MGQVLVVVSHEHLEHTRKVRLVQNQHPVESFRAGRAHKPLGHPVGLRRAKRRANDRDPVASKHLVKFVGEFLVPITNQETDVFAALRKRPRQLSGVLRHPRRARSRRASGQMHSPGFPAR
jgi:hypothetical protein